MRKAKFEQRRRVLLSTAILLAGLALAYVPLPGMKRTIVVVSGTELQEPLAELEKTFQQTHPDIQLTLKFQGSQDVINNYVDNRNDFKPTVLIPANGELLKELDTRWRAQNGSDPFYEPPRPIVKTRLVAVAWQDRGKVLFPDGQFRWQRLEQALQTGNWSATGGAADWGSFDFVMTDPTRSNSGQLTLDLWLQAKLGTSALTASSLNTPAVRDLLGLVKRSVYQPPRSTDILLQEFIARGPNDADVGIVYESVALYRWQQSATTQGKPYQIFYLNPTVETTPTAVIVNQAVDSGTVTAAKTFVDFLTQPEQQSVFMRYGFRPVNPAIDLQSVPGTPWQQNIPGAQVNPSGTVQPPPDVNVLDEIKRLWERAV